MKALLVCFALISVPPAVETHPTRACYSCDGTGWDHSKIQASKEGRVIWIWIPGIVQPFPLQLPKFQGSWHCDCCDGQGKIRQ